MSICNITKAMRERKVNHGKDTSPTLIASRFDGRKSSACERMLDELGLPSGQYHRSPADIIDDTLTPVESLGRDAPDLIPLNAVRAATASCVSKSQKGNTDDHCA